MAYSNDPYQDERSQRDDYAFQPNGQPRGQGQNNQAARRRTRRAIMGEDQYHPEQAGAQPPPGPPQIPAPAPPPPQQGAPAPAPGPAAPPAPAPGGVPNVPQPNAALTRS